MTVDGTCMDNRPFESKSRFSVPTGRWDKRNGEVPTVSSAVAQIKLMLLVSVGITNTNKFSW